MSKWRSARLDEIATSFAGGTPSRSVPEFFGGNIPWIKSTEVNQDRVFETEEFISELGLKSSSAKIIPSGAVLVAMYGATAGQVARLEIDATSNQAVLALVPKEALDAGFLYYSLVNQKENILYLAQGSGQPNLSKSLIDQVNLLIPQIDNQQKIAHILTTVDNLIEKTQALIDKYSTIKQGMMHDLFTRGIDLSTGQLRPSYEQAPQLYKETELGWLPREWRVNTYGELLQRIEAGKSPDCPDISPSLGEWGVVRVSAVNPNGFKSGESKRIENEIYKIEKFVIKKNDFLITRANTPELVGMVCFVDEIQPNLLLSDKTLRMIINPIECAKFYFFQFQMPHIRRQIEVGATGTSGSMKNIGQDLIRSFIVVRPGTNEQEEISKRLDAIEEKIKDLNNEIAKLVSIKNGLMQDLLTGKVKV